MYAGLFFVSLNTRPKYSPMTPMQTSWKPPMKSIAHNKVGKPATTSPHIIVFVMIYNIYRKASMEITKPTIVASFKGNVVNDTIPSMASFSRLIKFQEDSPATLSPCSNSTNVFLYPIQQNMPLVYLSDSRNFLNAEMHCLSKSLKSPTLGRTSILEVLFNIE